jgi:hypothetical protein
MYAILALGGFSVFAATFSPLRAVLALSTPEWISGILGYASIASIAVALLLLKTMLRPPAAGDEPGARAPDDPDSTRSLDLVGRRAI